LSVVIRSGWWNIESAVSLGISSLSLIYSAVARSSAIQLVLVERLLDEQGAAKSNPGLDSPTAVGDDKDGGNNGGSPDPPQSSSPSNARVHANVIETASYSKEQPVHIQIVDPDPASSSNAPSSPSWNAALDNLSAANSFDSTSSTTWIASGTAAPSAECPSPLNGATAETSVSAPKVLPTLPPRPRAPQSFSSSQAARSSMVHELDRVSSPASQEHVSSASARCATANAAGSSSQLGLSRRGQAKSGSSSVLPSRNADFADSDTKDGLGDQEVSQLERAGRTLHSTRAAADDAAATQAPVLSPAKPGDEQVTLQ